MYPEPALEKAESKANSLVLEEDCLYLVCSPGLWYGIDALIARLPTSSSILAIEVETELASSSLASLHKNFSTLLEGSLQASLKTKHLAGIDPDFFMSELKPQSPFLFLAQYDDVALEQALYLSLRSTVRRCKPISLNAGRLLNKSLYEYIENRALTVIQQFWQNRSTRMAQGWLWARNILKNLSYVSKKSNLALHEASKASSEFSAMLSTMRKSSVSAFPLTEMFSDLQTIHVVGAGTSLDLSYPILRASKSSTIFAADTAWSPLLARGVRADLVVALEGQVENLKDFYTDCSSLSSLALDISSHPSQFRHLRASKIFMYASESSPAGLWDTLRTQLPNIPVIPPLGSVGLTALYLAWLCRPRNIVIHGLDFCYPPGASHSFPSHSWFEQARSVTRLKSGSWSILGLAANQYKINEDLYSDPVLQSYRSVAMQLISAIQAQGIACFDAKGGSRFPILAQPLAITQVSEWDKEQAKQLPTRQQSKRMIAVYEGAEALLQNISEKVMRLRELLESRRSSGFSTTLVQNDEEYQLLRKLEFIFWDFPDRPWPGLDAGFQIRVLARLHSVSRLLPS